MNFPLYKIYLPYALSAAKIFAIVCLSLSSIKNGSPEVTDKR